MIGGEIGYRLLTWISPPEDRKRLASAPAASRTEQASKLEVHWGPGIWDQIEGKVVLDFGCGFGTEVIDLARHGARHVIGLDIRPEVLHRAREKARQAGVADRCTFTTRAGEEVDLITSIDAFEHFADPAGMLRLMADLLLPGGRMLASFGPTWYHPRGGHGFSVFPWAHLIFTERALIRWRSQFNSDGATRFHEISGGLNQMTIARFRRLVWESPFRFTSFEAIPIRAARLLCNPLTREFLASLVRCQLVHKEPLANDWTRVLGEVEVNARATCEQGHS